MNRVELVGRLTRNVEMKKTQNGKEVANFSVAVSRTYKKEGEDKPEADFFRCVAFEPYAKTCFKYLNKGSKVAVSGRLRSGKYPKNGQTIFYTDVLVEAIDFLEFKRPENEAEHLEEIEDMGDMDGAAYDDIPLPCDVVPQDE